MPVDLTALLGTIAERYADRLPERDALLTLAANPAWSPGAYVNEAEALDALEGTADARRQLADAFARWPILGYIPHAGQLPGWHSTARTQVDAGGNRSGKSANLLAKVASWAAGIVPLALQVDGHAGVIPVPASRPGALERVMWDPAASRYRMPVPNHGWIVCRTQATAHDTIWPSLLRLIPNEFVKRSDRQELTIELTNGSVIRVKSYEQKVSTFASKALHWRAFDEEPPKDIWVESSMRLIDYGGITLVAATPEQGFSFLHDEVEVPFRAGSAEHFYAAYTTFDNPYIPRAEILRMMEGKTPAEVLVRIFGRAVALDGTPAFNRVHLLNAIRMARDVTPVSIEEDGRLRVYEPALGGYRYGMGVDVSEGLGGDASVIQVVRFPLAGSTDGRLEQVATWHGQIPPEDLADVIDRIGTRYNRAWTYIEANNHGCNTISHLRGRYPRLLFQKLLDGATKEYVNRLGWFNDRRSKPTLVLDLRSFFETRDARGDGLVIHDPGTLMEMEYFVKRFAGKELYAATGGRHDDRVIALALAVQAYLAMGGAGYIRRLKRGQAAARLAGAVELPTAGAVGLDEAAEVVAARWAEQIDGLPEYADRKATRFTSGLAPDDEGTTSVVASPFGAW